MGSHRLIDLYEDRLVELIREVIREELARRAPAEWVSIATAAERFDVSESSVWRVIGEEKVPVLRRGRIVRVKVADLERALRGVAEPPATVALLGKVLRKG